MTHAKTQRGKAWRVCSSLMTWIGLLAATFIPHVCRGGDFSDSIILGVPLANLSVQDIEGHQTTFDFFNSSKAIVIVFVTTDCPIANSYQPAFQRLKHDFGEEHFQFFMVYVGRELASEKICLHRDEFSVDWNIAIDPEGKLAARLGARVTPEAVLISKSGEIEYRGRIDDRYPTYGKKRASATREDLRVAMTELRDGSQVSVKRTVAVGCIIKKSTTTSPQP